MNIEKPQSILIAFSISLVLLLNIMSFIYFQEGWRPPVPVLSLNLFILLCLTFTTMLVSWRIAKLKEHFQRKNEIAQIPSNRRGESSQKMPSQFGKKQTIWEIFKNETAQLILLLLLLTVNLLSLKYYFLFPLLFFVFLVRNRRLP